MFIYYYYYYFVLSSAACMYSGVKDEEIGARTAMLSVDVEKLHIIRRRKASNLFFFKRKPNYGNQFTLKSRQEFVVLIEIYNII